MIKDTNKRLTEEERKDASYIITGLNTTLNYLKTIQDFSSLNEDQMKQYWEGICDVFIANRMEEYKWRKDISEKYDLPYTFISRNGDLLIEEPEE